MVRKYFIRIISRQMYLILLRMELRERYLVAFVEKSYRVLISHLGPSAYTFGVKIFSDENPAIPFPESDDFFSQCRSEQS